MNQNRINEIYKVLEEIVFSIPDFASPDEITTSIFNCRERINIVEKLAIEVNRASAKFRRDLFSKRKERQIKYNELIRENPEVKKGKSGLDRQAIAESLLSTIDIEISDLESQMTELKYLAEAIELRISNLNKTNSDIRLAWSVMQNTSSVVHDVIPQETVITAEDLEGLDLGITSKEVQPIKISADDISKLDLKPKKSKEIIPKQDLDEDGFSLDKIESLEEVSVPEMDLTKEEVGTPIDLEEITQNLTETKKESPKKEPSIDLEEITQNPIETKKEPSKKEPSKKSKEVLSDEEPFASAVSSNVDDIDINDFLNDLS